MYKNVTLGSFVNGTKWNLFLKVLTHCSWLLTLSTNMVTKIKQIQNRKCFISLRSKVSWKLTLPAGFQPGGVFRFENKASGYFDTAIKDLETFNWSQSTSGEERLKYILPRKNKNRSTKTIKSPPHTLPPPPPHPASFTLIGAKAWL